MVTPMRNGSIDEEAVRGLVERLIQKGVNGIFILGTNGEFHVLSREEKVKLAAKVEEYPMQEAAAIPHRRLSSYRRLCNRRVLLHSV